MCGNYLVKTWKTAEGRSSENLLKCIFIRDFDRRHASAPLTRLSLIDGDPVRCGEPLVALDVVNSVLQVAVAFCEINLQQVSQQILQVGAEVRGESHLRWRTNACVGFWRWTGTSASNHTCLPSQTQSSHRSEWVDLQKMEGSQLPFHRWGLPVPTSPQLCYSPKKIQTNNIWTRAASSPPCAAAPASTGN